MQFGVKEKTTDKLKIKRKAKTKGSYVSLDGDITNQAIVATNPRKVYEKAYSNHVEEAKRTWDLSKKLGLCHDLHPTVTKAQGIFIPQQA